MICWFFIMFKKNWWLLLQLKKDTGKALLPSFRNWIAFCWLHYMSYHVSLLRFPTMASIHFIRTWVDSCPIGNQSTALCFYVFIMSWASFVIGTYCAAILWVTFLLTYVYKIHYKFLKFIKERQSMP